MTGIVKNFDELRATRVERDRKFQIGGETFTRRPAVRPEALAKWEHIGKHGSEMTSEEVLADMDETICNLIEPGASSRDHKRWHKLRERDDDPITGDDMISLITWIVEDMTDRPTVPSGTSSDEPERTGASSTDDSSSPGLTAVSAA